MRHCALRRGRCSLDGQPYLVTFTTHDRAQFFADPRLAHAACISIVDARLWKRATLLAWVLMPDHWHGLLVPQGESLSRSVQRLKANSARCVNLAAGRSGAVWTPAFHDRALRRDEDIAEAARYIVANPIRAGLIRRVGDYPYWNAIWLDDPTVGAT